ncbi:hypothetical protein R1sor_017621 [Riccia sorocarpa]|uniref:Reverse transcriptase zinc-binding domain-containing protein n=1 Tax=Riccia sorocarpa TaxID=122646 RepID=A0ABD3IAP3_9MARC
MTLPLPTCSGWKWRGDTGTQVRTGWSHETKWWKSMLRTEADTTRKPNRRWDADISAQAWNKVWTLTWKKPSTSREGFWWWRTLWQGFWNGDRTRKAHVSSGECPRCLQEVDTTEHLFWACPKFKLQSTELKKTNSAWWAVAAELYKMTWRERCDVVFRNSQTQRPLQAIIKETLRSVTAWLFSSMPEHQRITTARTLETLQEWESKLASSGKMAPPRPAEERANVERLTHELDRATMSEVDTREQVFRLSSSPVSISRVRRIIVSHVEEEGPLSPVLPDCVFPGHE